jgi:hypothetical protein
MKHATSQPTAGAQAQYEPPRVTSLGTLAEMSLNSKTQVTDDNSVGSL